MAIFYRDGSYGDPPVIVSAQRIERLWRRLRQLQRLRATRLEVSGITRSIGSI